MKLINLRRSPGEIWRLRQKAVENIRNAIKQIIHRLGITSENIG